MNKNHLMSHITAPLLAAALLAGSLSAAAASDIQGHWAEPNITKWVSAGKISGYPDGTFRPDRTMTRAEFAVLLAGVTPKAGGADAEEHVFADVAQEQWFYDAVMQLTARGVIMPDEHFRPDDRISRQEVMTMVGRAFAMAEFDTGCLDAFSDREEIAEYAEYFVAGFVAGGHVGGYPDGTLRPQAEITRAECVKMLDSLGLVKDPASLSAIMENIYAGVETRLPAVIDIEINDENAEYYLGLPDLAGIEEALASEAMLGAIAHSVCLVRVKDGTDAAALAEQIRTSVNPRKWICVGVEREEIVMAVRGNLILMVINPSVPQEIADSFLALDLPGDAEQPEQPDEEDKTPIVPGEDGLLLWDGYYMDDIGALRPESVSKFADKITSLCDKYLAGANSVSYAVIPSKSYFVNDRLETSFDFDGMQRMLAEQITCAQQIDLAGALTLEDYYKTDPHWRQERLQGVLDRLGEKLNFSVSLDSFTAHTVENFTGQHGQKKENFPSEQLVYLTSAATDGADVDNWQNKEFRAVYNTAALDTDSAYDLFLSGPTPLEVITNPAASSDRELVIFRDSYTSALAPLLIGEYKSITLIDIRYMLSAYLGDYVDFDGKDVLFLYNDQVVNHSEMLR